MEANEVVQSDTSFQRWWPNAAKQYFETLQPHHQSLLYTALMDVKSQREFKAMLTTSTESNAWYHGDWNDQPVEQKLYPLLRKIANSSPNDSAIISNESQDLAILLIRSVVKEYVWAPESLQAFQDSKGTDQTKNKVESLLLKTIAAKVPTVGYFTAEMGKLLRRVPVADMLTFAINKMGKDQHLQELPQLPDLAELSSRVAALLKQRDPEAGLIKSDLLRGVYEIITSVAREPSINILYTICITTKYLFY